MQKNSVNAEKVVKNKIMQIKIKVNQKVYVLDTNIILNDASNIFSIAQGGDNLIVIPETVIDEIDSKKVGFDEINFQAREFARILSNAKIIDRVTVSKPKDRCKDGDIFFENGPSITRMQINDKIFIDIISFDRYPVANYDKSLVNDRKIIFCASFVKHFYTEMFFDAIKNKKNNSKKTFRTIFLTLDAMCRLRAISEGLESEVLLNKGRNINPEFIRDLKLKKGLSVRKIEGKNIRDIVLDHKPENYCYKIMDSTGVSELAVIEGGIIRFINPRDFKISIRPRNDEQVFALHGMLNPAYQVVLIDALAGSGKTLLAVSAGIKNIAEKRYAKLIYIRNSVESLDKGEEVGFLSGNDKKFEIYNFPLYDTLDFIVRAKHTKSNHNKTPAKQKTISEEEIQAEVKNMIKNFNIETMWNGSIRGRTITNAYVIVDEIQNFSKKSLKTVLTRLDQTCKVVCIGSNGQIDNTFINRYTNGLSYMLEAATNEGHEVNIFATTLHKAERGIITAFAERILA